jgi:Zn-dependent protease
MSCRCSQTEYNGVQWDKTVLRQKEGKRLAKTGSAGKRWGPFGWLGALAALLGSKLKVLLALLKWGKLGGTLWTMALMIVTYAWIYPWTIAVGLVLMLLIHETGHILAAKQKGLPVTAPAFIPFLGAVILMKKHPSDAVTEAYVAYGGPFLGSLGALAVFFAARLTGYTPLYAIAQIGFFLNLINLLPIHPLDGGRIVTAISRWLWVVGLVGGLAVILYVQIYVFLFFWALFAWELYVKYVRKQEPPRELAVFREWVVPLDRFAQAGIPVPGERHRRALPFEQICRLAERDEVCRVRYPGISPAGEIPFDRGRITKVELVRTTRKGDEVLLRVKMTVEPLPEYRYGSVREEEYYRVAPAVRWAFGLAYFGLAAVLGWMVTITPMVAAYLT